MATGITTTDALADSLPSVIGAARIVREIVGVMTRLVDKVTLGPGTGTSWNEVSLAQLTAQELSETTELDNPQQLSDTMFSITPTVKGMQTLITDRVAARMSVSAFARVGMLSQNAIQRKKDEDGLAMFSGATTTLAGAGTTLASGHIAAAASRITSNSTEPGQAPIRAVLHGFQIKDIHSGLLTGLTASGAEQLIQGGGLAERVFAQGFQGTIHSAQVFEDGNIAIDASDDARGGVFSRDAIVLVQGRSPRSEVRREPHIGGGATSIFIYDEYAFGERSPGNWLYAILSDATAPTS